MKSYIAENVIDGLCFLVLFWFDISFLHDILTPHRVCESMTEGQQMERSIHKLVSSTIFTPFGSCGIELIFVRAVSLSTFLLSTPRSL